MFKKFFAYMIEMEPLILPFILFVLFVKLVLFLFCSAKQRKPGHFFYYADSQIIDGSFKRTGIKIIQNCLTFYLVFLIAIDIILLTTGGKASESLTLNK